MRPTTSPIRAVLAAAFLLSLPPNPAAAAPPPEGECPVVHGLPNPKDPTEDAAPVMLKEGMQVDIDHLLMLRRLLPPKIWQHREVFFHEGMRMEIGACHRRYAPQHAYRDATRRYAGQAKLDSKGNLENYTAGLPFAPEDIDPKANDAGLRWAWDLELRSRGAGHRGRFRLVDIPARTGGTHVYEGRWFLLQTSHRADLPESGYHLADQGDRLWAAGGEFLEPFDTRHLAWRQFRPAESLEDWQEPDDTFVYLPEMRKQRRAATSWVDGLYVPSYLATGSGSGGGMQFGSGQAGVGSGSISPTAGRSIAVSENKETGLIGLAIRPNAYAWRVLGEQVVLAPLNGVRAGYPIDDKRNYGPSGLSPASDRWDVRWAVIIEGATRRPDSEVRTVEIWVDWQTQEPLYWITRTSRRRLVDIGILVHRYTGDIHGYPEWPGGVPTNVFEPVAAFFYDALAGGGGWRRESYDLLSTPFRSGEIRVMTSQDVLDHGR